MASQFHRHPWPYASAFSLIGCYARINVLGRREMLSQWIAPKRISRVERSLDWKTLPHAVGIDVLCRTFNLGPHALSLAFDPGAWWPVSLGRVASQIRSSLRFCPECIHQGFHSELFQLPWWRLCPIHHETLLEHCPNCSNIISKLPFWSDGDPPRVFCCSQCGFDLADTGAIVMATHGNAPDTLHQIVGAHFRWARSVDECFVVPPLFAPTIARLERSDALAFLSVAQIALPTELEGIADVPRREHPFPLQLKMARLSSDDPQLISRVARHIDMSGFPDHQIGTQRFSLSWAQAKWMLALERRIQLSFGRPVARAHWDWLHRGRQRKVAEGEPTMHRPSPMAETWEQGFLERGYRRRTKDMAISTNLVGQSSLDVRDLSLVDLSAVRVLIGLRSFLQSGEVEQPRVQALRKVVEWWYTHFLALALIDGTIYAAHQDSYIDGSSEDPYLTHCWPRVGLDRGPPGHHWAIAAARQDEGRTEVLSAYIVPIRYGPLLNPEQLYNQERLLRRERLERDLHDTIEIVKRLNDRRAYGEF